MPATTRRRKQRRSVVAGRLFPPKIHKQGRGRGELVRRMSRSRRTPRCGWPWPWSGSSSSSSGFGSRPIPTSPSSTNRSSRSPSPQRPGQGDLDRSELRGVRPQGPPGRDPTASTTGTCGSRGADPV